MRWNVPALFATLLIPAAAMGSLTACHVPDTSPATEDLDASSPLAEAATQRNLDGETDGAHETDSTSAAQPELEAGAGDADDAAADATSTMQKSDGQRSDDASALRTALVLPERWQKLDAATDPFHDRPDPSDCPASAALPEPLGGEQAFGVDTGSCHYLTAIQPCLREVAPGELLKVRLWHFELSAPDPAEAHAALLMDGLAVLDERVPIPQPGGLITRQLRAPRAIPAGAPVHFHLHNHGANSWALVEVSAGP